MGHAGLFLKSIDGFLIIVGAWTDVLLGALAGDVVDGAVVEAMVLAKGAPPRL